MPCGVLILYSTFFRIASIPRAKESGMADGPAVASLSTYQPNPYPVEGAGAEPPGGYRAAMVICRMVSGRRGAVWLQDWSASMKRARWTTDASHPPEASWTSLLGAWGSVPAGRVAGQNILNVFAILVFMERAVLKSTCILGPISLMRGYFWMVSQTAFAQEQQGGRP